MVDGVDATGRRVRIAARTREEAEVKRAELVQQSQQAAPSVEDRDILLDEYFGRWLQQIATTVAPRTFESYSESYRRYVGPALGKMKVRAIHRGHIKALLTKKRAEGLSNNSVRLIRATVSVLLGDAVDDALLQTNPAVGIGRRGRKQPDTITQLDRQKAVRAMTYEQYASFLSMVGSRCQQRDAVLLLTLGEAGLRPGEACGLRWTDFESTARTLRLACAVDNQGRIKTIKTAEARVIDLTPRLVDALDALQATQEADALIAGADEVSPWVFVNAAGSPPTPQRTATLFARALRAAQLPHFRLYDLRHRTPPT
jgi:integrase